MRIQLQRLPAALLLSSIFVFPILADNPSEQEFRITDASGQTSLTPKGADHASPAAKGVPLMPGDKIMTGDKGRVEIATKEGTVFELKEKSYLRVQKISGAESRFFLRAGRFLGHFASALKTGHYYRIQTPVAVASVRGTELALVQEDQGQLQGGVVEGKVSFERAPRLDPSKEFSDNEEEETSGPETAASTATVAAKEEPVVVASYEGISVKPNGLPKKLDTIPPIVVPDLNWFQSVRDRVPKLRDEWKDLDTPSKMALRQKALRERIQWNPPQKVQPSKSLKERYPRPSPPKKP